MAATDRRFPDLPPVWALAFALAAIALGRWLPPGPFQNPAWRWLGVALMLAGFGLAIWAARWFRRKRTTIYPSGAPTRLIVEGPFRINRNPIYTGMALILAGWAFILGSAVALVPVALFVLVITRRFIPGEEAALRRIFGAEAEDYLRRTRRW